MWLSVITALFSQGPERTGALGVWGPVDGAGPAVGVLPRWCILGRYHALVAVNAGLAPERLRALHQPVLCQLRRLLKRGQQSGACNAELPIEWMLTVLLELVHAARHEYSTGRLPQDKAEAALIATVLGSLSNPQPQSRTAR